MEPDRLRRQPLACVWLWFNAACQASGLDTAWVACRAAGPMAEPGQVRRRIAELRAREHPASGAK